MHIRYCRAPGKTFLGFNISMQTFEEAPAAAMGGDGSEFIGDFSSTEQSRLAAFSLGGYCYATTSIVPTRSSHDHRSSKHTHGDALLCTAGVRSLVPYNRSMHEQRALFFPGHHRNRLLTHFYSLLFFASEHEDRRAKRFMRDRLRYHDEIFCTGSRVVEKLLMLQVLADHPSLRVSTSSSSINHEEEGIALKLLSLMERNAIAYSSRGDGDNDTTTDSSTTYSYDAEEPAITPSVMELIHRGLFPPSYVAFHIRRGDFQQTQTRQSAEKIVEQTNALVPNRSTRIAYIATDESNRSFFAPFMREYRAVYFLADLKSGTDIDTINQNYVGMIEQVVCANADVFIGTPLSTFTAYITRIRGYMNRTLSSAHQRASVRVPGAVLDRSGGLFAID